MNAALIVPISVMIRINLIDSMVAILTLQNTMILANDGDITGSMKVVSIISSTIIWIIIVALSTISFYFTMKKIEKSIA